MKIKEIIGNDKLNVEVNSISQVKKISNKLIRDNNYHTNRTKLEHEQTEQSQRIRIPETGTEWKDKKVENQTKKLKRQENITHIAKNIKINRKGSTEKYGENIRVQHFEERVEKVMTEEMFEPGLSNKNMMMWQRKYQIANYKKNVDKGWTKKGKSRRTKV